MKFVLVLFAVVSLSQGFPRPSAPKDKEASRRQGVHYGYPEAPSDPYTSTQATAYSDTPSYATTWSKPEELTASYHNTAADQSSSAQKATTASPYASQSQTADRQTDSSTQSSQTQADQSSKTPAYDAQSQTSTSAQTQNTQAQTQADQSSSQGTASAQTQGTQAQTQADQSSTQGTASAQTQNTQAQTHSDQSSTQGTASAQTQNTQAQTQADQSSASKTTTASPYAAQSQTNDNQAANTQAQGTQTQAQADPSSAQKPTTPSPYASSQSQTTPNAQVQNTQTQTSTQADTPAGQTQDSASKTTQNTASQTSVQTPTYQNSPASGSESNAAASTAQSTQSQTSQDSTSSTQTSAPTPQNQDTSSAANQAQSYPSQTTNTAQDSTSSQSNADNQNKNSGDYVNPPQPYNAGQSNPQSGTSSQSTTESKSSDNPQGYSTPADTQYKVENVTSKTVSDPNQAGATAPVSLSSTATASVKDSSNPDDNKKSAAVNKETTVNGNHATTYLELPKIIHKPAIVKYEVQIAPKVKGVPIEQEIAIMPPEGTKGERKPLVLLKQVVSKPTDERIQVIIPKTESDAISSPKVEVKGGHVDQEALNSQNQDQYQSQGQTTEQSQSEYQGQYQGQDQSQSQYQGQYQDQYQGQDDACGDHSACESYNPNMCNQVWMKRHCKKMCGLCTPPEEEAPMSTSSLKETSAPKHCEYSGVVHQSGETWSPGPCVPKCHCDNGNIKCSKLECPDLNCDKPVKRRWKCCAECLPNSDNETKCGVETTGGNGESLCCVFPFNYRGVDYFTCTATDAEEPWCSITRNYDRDGLWGNCVVKSETGKKHIKQADSDEKTALILATQLSGARKWRNSTNNQVTDALKAVPSPLSADDRQKLKASDATSSYAGASNVDQNASGASNDISAQADYYKTAGVDLSQVSALDNARKNPDYAGASSNGDYKVNSTTYTSPEAQPLQSSPPKSSEQAVNNNTYNPSGYYGQPAGDTYSNNSYQAATRNDGYSSETVGSTTDARGTNAGVSNTATSNTAGYNAVGYDTTETSGGRYNSGVSDYGASNTGGSNTGGSNTGGSNTGGSNTGESTAGGPNSDASNAGSTNTAKSNTGASNPYSSYYNDANTQSGVKAYSGSYGQQSTSKDTTDNTVPNGIENQTSYQMNPDASTAQYGNNEPANT